MRFAGSQFTNYLDAKMTKDDPLFPALLDSKLARGKDKTFGFGAIPDGVATIGNDKDLLWLIRCAITPAELNILRVVLNKAAQEGLGLSQSVMYEVTAQDYMEASNMKFIDEAEKALKAAVDLLYKNEVRYVLDNCRHRSRLISSVVTSSESADVAVGVTVLLTDLFNKNKALNDVFSWNLLE